MKEFTMIKQLIKDDHEKKVKDAVFYIQRGFLPSWAPEHRANADKGLESYSTPTRWRQYQAGEITREKAVEFATKRALKKIEKKTAADLAKLDRIAAAPDLEYISISVEWVRSSTWGYNPHAEVQTETGVFYGRASGCGYDKRSAAVANALNQCDSVLKVLCTLKENGLRAGLTDICKDCCTGHSNRNICGYGAGYNVIPYFERGVGVSCFWDILKKCGFSTLSHDGKYTDFYSITKEENKNESLC